ncbi:MAG: hypothetical protein R2769_01455 [Saprospiraceae bacterium]
MNSIEKIKRRLYEYYLKKALQGPEVKRKSLSLQQAKSIGILFEATHLDEKQIVEKFAARLKKEQKKVELLGYFHSKQESENFPFSHFNKKDLDFALRPKSEDVKSFINTNFDLLICINTRELLPMHYIASCSKAGFRIGPASERTSSYDMMIDTKRPEDIQYFLQQMEFFLNKMTPQNEPTPA